MLIIQIVVGASERGNEKKMISPQELILAARTPECPTCGYKGYTCTEFRIRCKKCGRVLVKQ